MNRLCLWLGPYMKKMLDYAYRCGDVCRSRVGALVGELLGDLVGTVVGLEQRISMC